MNKTAAYAFSKTPSGWWSLLGLTALLWLLVCAWVMKTLDFWGVQDELGENEHPYSVEQHDSGSELNQLAQTEVPKLKLLKEGAIAGGHADALSEAEGAESTGSADVIEFRVVAKPEVVSATVSSFTELDRTEELALNNDANRQNHRSAEEQEQRMVTGGVPANVPLDESGEQTAVGSAVDFSNAAVNQSGSESGSESSDEAVGASSDADSFWAEYERLRNIELRVLDELSRQIRFDSNSTLINQGLEKVLDRMFEPLYLYSDTQVIIRVATIESTAAASNSLLSRGRGQAIVTYWVNRGLAFDRFSIFIEPGDGLPFGTHRVRVLPEGISR